MKKKLTYLFSCLFAFSFFGTLNAQTESIYQLPNGGFETWYRETSNAGSIVPTGFNSFYSAETTVLTQIGVAQRCDSSRDVRADATGTFSLYMYSNTTLGVRANGNVTTGRMKMGSATALHLDNHNWTNLTTNPPKHYQEITGTPDYLRFWVKYLPGRSGATNTTDMARIRVYIHGTEPCRDAPIYPAGMTETQQYYGKAMKEFYKEDGEWNCYEVPFEYTGTNIQRNANGNYYVLLSMTTNATPGGGANNPDHVWFDDIEFVYSAWLADLKVNGETIDGFQMRLLTYGGPKLTGYGPYEFPYQPEDFSWTPEAEDIIGVEVTNVPGPEGDANGGYTSILVTAEDGVTQVEYRIYYFVYLSDDNTLTAMSYTIDGETLIPVPGFTPAQENYPIPLTDPEEVRVPQIVESSIEFSDPTASIQYITQPAGVNSKGTVAVRAENFSIKSYNLLFSKVISSNSKLNWIRIANVNIPDFDPEILEYNHIMTSCVTAIPAVTYEKSSAYAAVSYTPATMANRTATITVTAEDGSQSIYKINFILNNNDVSFTRFRFSAGNSYDITQTSGQTTYERSIPFTAAQTITPTWNCTAVTVNRVPASTVYYPDTNYFHVTAQDGITTVTYKIVLKNTNCYVATGNNSGFRYNYNGATNQNTGINITTANNNNLNPVITSTVTLPVGPNVPPELVVYGLNTSIAPPTYTILQPASRNDTATVTLTANDGVTQKIYRVPFRATLSTDASLNNLMCDGISIPSFTPNTLNYTVWLSANVTQVPEITGTPAFQWLPAENIVVTPAENLLGTTIITVTAENGTTTRTYTVDFDVEPVDNAYLSVLTYDGIVVSGFKPTTFNYWVDIPYSNVCPKVAGIPMAANASVFHEQSNTEPCTAKILVISENLLGMKIYTISFNMVKSTDATLADIKINGISLPDFNPEEFVYDYELDYTEFELPVVTAVPTYPKAHVDISEIENVTGTVTLSVTAEDESYSATYTVNITRELSPVTEIETIYYDYNDQSYFYQTISGQTEIAIMLPVETEGEPLITDIQLADYRADFVIEEQPDASNNLTGTVLVTAEDFSEKIYTIAFERILSESTLLTGIWYNGIPIDFDPEILTYDIILAYSTSQIPNVTATAPWIHTDVVILQATTVFGQATVTVNSENGENHKTYTINFLRKGNPHLVALFYNLDGEIAEVPGFNPLTQNYNVELLLATTAVPTLEYILEDNRCDVETGLQDTPNGTSWLKIVTWNQDDSLTYTVNFTVLLSTEAILSDLQVDGETVSDFDPETLNYFIEYEYGKVDIPVVTATATKIDATVDIVQIDGFPGVATVTVSAGVTTITSTYTVSFSVEPGNNTYLSEILIDEIPFWLFNKDLHFYTLPLPLGTTYLPEIDATPEDPRADVEIIQAGQFGDTAKIIVTALNGEIAIYQIYFPEPKNTNAYASMLYVDWEPLEGFLPYISEYSVTLPYNYTGKPLISVELQDLNAEYEKIFPDELPLTATIIVTAENEENKFIYTIHFYKESSIIDYNETEIRAYPNPSSDIIHFEIKEINLATTLEIFSVEGKKVAHYTLQAGMNTLNISHFQKGFYFFKASTEETMIGVGKFVKN